MVVLKNRFIPLFRILFLNALALFFIFSGAAFAEDLDQQGCTDHPMISRMPNFYIDDCSKAFDEMEVVVGKTQEGEQIQVIEGNITRLAYFLKEDVPQPSVLQILKNHETALTRIGCSILYKNEDLLTARLTLDGKDIWISLFISDGTIYELSIAEPSVMDQEVVVSDMYDTLNRDGFVALYIDFDTGQAQIKTESFSLIDQVATLLEKYKTLRISIEGHTDNVGDASANTLLSLNRAKAVMKALIEKGIQAERLSARGWGQKVPVADNRKEQGRERNRRVEIVKQ